MVLTLLEHPRCATCQKAKKLLDANNVFYRTRHIVKQNPTVEELKKWADLSDKGVKGLFNYAGLVYKKMNLKDKLPNMSEAEQLELLASNGMLVKRPLLVHSTFVFVGFKEEEWLKKM